MRRLFLIALAAVIVAGVVLGLVLLQGGTRPGAVQRGTLVGTVTIGPLCPVEPCPNPPPDVYSSRQLLLISPIDEIIRIPLDREGRFRAEVPARQYTVDLTECNFLGCAQSLPTTVTVAPGRVTTLEIGIDTGIR
jgi:hypothetical protein